MKARVPAMLTRGLSVPEREEFQRWWAGLAASERRSLQQRPGSAPVGVIARLADPDREQAADPNVDFYEYLVNHELSLEDGRRFHICSAHPEARALLRDGWIPARFQCPRATQGCPMRALLAAADGASVELALVSPGSLAKRCADG